jgi:excisionase family DNA binding protein
MRKKSWKIHLNYSLIKLITIEESLKELRIHKTAREKQTESLPEFLNITQASEYLHIAKPTIYGLTSSRKIPHFKTGKRIYFKRNELNIYITKNRVATKEEIENNAAEWIARKYQSKKK